MRSNALKKNTHNVDAIISEVADPQAIATWESVRQSIAKTSEEACKMPANQNDPDFDEFEAKYGLGAFA